MPRPRLDPEEFDWLELLFMWLPRSSTIRRCIRQAREQRLELAEIREVLRWNRTDFIQVNALAERHGFHPFTKAIDDIDAAIRITERNDVWMKVPRPDGA